MYKNNCYVRNHSFARTPKGIVIHSTGANNPKLARYVQPYSGQTEGTAYIDSSGVSVAKTASQMITLLGKHTGSNDWNKPQPEGIPKCVSAFIGKMADSTVATVQTLLWDCNVWGSGEGPKGSCNGTHIQFECCEDACTDAGYFAKIWDEALALLAHLCNLYGLSASAVVSHKEAYDLGFGSNHGDIDAWFTKQGSAMAKFRAAVAAKITKRG
ncbi:N-acetylmuramoyl-L-alanine amidase [uncultured Thiodictyon sp.]|uniref:N-acetylmuramoyl-L-alanine amidase n=1 Tax=uncultured Thiodictyon sp. TaxID=1846217 RepID=UPI0025CCCF1B|nr:N-acetylmuramoyl-L-alanine amidase [uncultured Thiodictyon sp.]